MSLTESPVRESPAAIRRRLFNPVGGRDSSELEILGGEAARRERMNALVLQRTREGHERKLLMEARQRRAGELMRDYQFKLTAWVLGETDEPAVPEVPKILFEQILAAVSKFYDIPRTHILSHRKTADLVRPRQAVMYLGRELTELSLPMISARLGGRDHTTVHHGHRKVQKALADGDQALAAEIAAIKQSLEAE